jgi:DNA-binding LacI/PurR family transcriptional regulator
VPSRLIAVIGSTVERSENAMGRSGSAPTRRCTLADVAAAARTSSPIASRILNKDPSLSVGLSLRRRVEAAARDLGYRPHAAARALRSSSTGALGFLVPTLSNPVFHEIVRGATACAIRHDFVVLLLEDPSGDGTRTEFAELVSAGRIDGLIIASARASSLVGLQEELGGRHIPHVFLNRGVAGSERNVVLDDDRGIGMAVDHLVGLGHRRMAHIDGPLDIDPAARRIAAFRRHAARHPVDAAYTYSGEFLVEGGAEAARDLLMEHPEVTGLIVSGPSQAAGILTVAMSLGRRVPEDLSIVSYTDAPLAHVVTPPLTVVDMPLRAMGAAGVEALVAQLPGDTPPGDRVVDGEVRLVVRGSTAPAPAG